MYPLQENHAYQHEYYGPIINNYIQTILKSGQLTDEDSAALLGNCTFRINIDNKSYHRPPLKLLSSLFLTLGTVIAVKRYHQPVLFLPSAVITLSFLYLERKTWIKKKMHKEIVGKVIESLIKVHRLNITIIRYMKIRAEVGATKETEYFVLYNKNIEDFVKTMANNASELFAYILFSLSYFTDLLDDLTDDFEYLRQIEIDTSADLTNIEDCLKMTSKIHDIHVLLASKFLNFLGLVLCSSSSKIDVMNVKNILDGILPEVLIKLNTHYDNLSKQFNHLRYSTNKKIEFNSKTKQNNRHISTNLERTLIHSVNNLSIVMEKAQAVLRKAESLENDDNFKELGSAVADLRDHTFATYESLDVICKLYGILSNTNLNVPIKKLLNAPKETNQREKQQVSIKFDDSLEPIEENYELYVAGNDKFNDVTPTNYEDPSGAYLNVMLQELKQSLRQHQRFIAAKNRRGSDDNDQIDHEIKEIADKKIQPPPKFDLNALNELPPMSARVNEIVKIKSEPLAPPLPPPPPPGFSLKHLEQENGKPNSRSMLDNIKVLSSQIQAEEEVFGDSFEDSDFSDTD